MTLVELLQFCQSKPQQAHRRKKNGSFVIFNVVHCCYFKVCLPVITRKSAGMHLECVCVCVVGGGGQHRYRVWGKSVCQTSAAKYISPAIVTDGDSNEDGGSDSLNIPGIKQATNEQNSSVFRPTSPLWKCSILCLQSVFMHLFAITIVLPVSTHGCTGVFWAGGIVDAGRWLYLEWEFGNSLP